MTVDPDALYQSFDKNLYRINGDAESDSIMQMMQADPSVDNSANVTVSASDFGSGVDTSTTVQTTGSMQAGKKTYDNTVSGYILGVDPSVGIAKFYIGNTTAYMNWDGSTLTIKGSISASSIDIPDTTTASSFHVDSSGNTWWGATTLAASTANVTAAGVGTFAGLSVINKKAYTNFETSARFTTGAAGTGAVTFGNQGVTIDTGANATSYARVLWYIANAFTNNPTFVCTLVVNTAPPGTGQAFIGLGQPTTSGTGHTFNNNNVIGFEIVNVLGSSILSIRGVVNNNNATALVTSYFASTVTTGDTLELFVKVNTATVDFYIRKNGGTLSAKQTISSQIPTGASETSVQFSVSNQSVANQTQLILQCAGYEH